MIYKSRGYIELFLVFLFSLVPRPFGSSCPNQVLRLSRLGLHLWAVSLRNTQREALESVESVDREWAIMDESAAEKRGRWWRPRLGRHGYRQERCGW